MAVGPFRLGVRLHDRRGQRLAGGGGAADVMASLVAYSRVHTGVHYPADTIAGALSGMALAQIAIAWSRPRTHGR